jgi:hypothetical protein
VGPGFWVRPIGPSGGIEMGDVVFIGLSVGFFALSWLFIRLCERV